MTWHKGIFIFFIILFFVFLQPANAQRGFKVEKIERVTVISNPKHPIPRNGLKKRIVFKEELSIGVIEGDENYMFGSFIMFNTDDEGNFYVSDFDNKRIQKYDQQGKYLLTIGRAGQGPGEFEFLSMPRFDVQNNLYVYDFISRRISFFDRNGKFLRQISKLEMSIDMYVNTKGFIVGSTSAYIQQKGGFKNVINFGLFDKECKAIKILFTDEDERKRIWEKGIGTSVNQKAFKPNLIYKLINQDIIYYGYPDKYEINICSPEGKLIKRITRDYYPQKISLKDKNDYFKHIKKSASSRGINDQLIEKIIKMTRFVKYKPVYYNFTLLENGWLFVIVDFAEGNQSIIDLFDKEGRYIAQFKTNIHTKSLFFKNGKAYAVAYEEDFPFVKRYAIELQEYKNNQWLKSNIKLY